MQKDYRKWKSPLLGRDAEIVVHGEGGTPIIVLPTADGNEREWEENGLLAMVSEQIEFEYNQIWCLGPSIFGSIGVPQNSKSPEVALNPRNSGARSESETYEAFVIDEILPLIREQNTNPYLMIAGAREGGAMAIQLAFNHPDLFSRVIVLSGSFADENAITAINVQTERLQDLDIRLLNYTNDPLLKQGRKLHEILALNFVPHQFNIWDRHVHHPWRLWSEMFRENIL